MSVNNLVPAAVGFLKPIKLLWLMTNLGQIKSCASQSSASPPPNPWSWPPAPHKKVVQQIYGTKLGLMSLQTGAKEKIFILSKNCNTLSGCC